MTNTTITVTISNPNEEQCRIINGLIAVARHNVGMTVSNHGAPTNTPAPEAQAPAEAPEAPAEAPAEAPEAPAPTEAPEAPSLVTKQDLQAFFGIKNNQFEENIANLGIRVSWRGKKYQCTGTLIEVLYNFDPLGNIPNWWKDADIVRIRRDDNGKVLTLNWNDLQTGGLTRL